MSFLCSVRIMRLANLVIVKKEKHIADGASKIRGLGLHFIRWQQSRLCQIRSLVLLLTKINIVNVERNAEINLVNYLRMERQYKLQIQISQHEHLFLLYNSKLRTKQCEFDYFVELYSMRRAHLFGWTTHSLNYNCWLSQRLRLHQWICIYIIHF